MTVVSPIPALLDCNNIPPNVSVLVNKQLLLELKFQVMLSNFRSQGNILNIQVREKPVIRSLEN